MNTLEAANPSDSAHASAERGGVRGFHNHAVRQQWDTLLSEAYMEDGANYPSIGAISVNVGRSWRRAFVLRTRFVNYVPGRTAAAMLVAPIRVFADWSASLQHRDMEDGRSLLIYSFNVRLRPRWLGWLADPLANWLFARETRRRFAALARYLQNDTTLNAAATEARSR